MLRSGGLPRRTREAAWLAVATGVSITAYSAVDRVGVRTVPAWLYASLIWTFGAAFLVGGIAIADRLGRRSAELAFESAAVAIAGDGEPDGPPADPAAVDRRHGGWGRAVVGGLVTVVAYMLVLVAYTFAPLAVVAPVRESAIVLVSGWGSFRLGEAASRRVGLTRLASAAVIVVGAFLLALEG